MFDPAASPFLYLDALVACAARGMSGVGAAPWHRCALGPRGGAGLALAVLAQVHDCFAEKTVVQLS